MIGKQDKTPQLSIFDTPLNQMHRKCGHNSTIQPRRSIGTLLGSQSLG